MKSVKSICYLFIIVIFLPEVFISCISESNTKNIQFATDSLVAHFDYFNYSGNDDFYNENPLPDDDYYYNPILPGWYSDPCLCSNGEDYFLVTSTFSYFPGVPIFHSKDLMNWKQIGHVLDRSSQLPLNGQKVSEGIFAPAISYNPNNKTYYMITTNIRKGNFFVKTQDPFGEWSDPVWLPEVHGIDPSFFFDDNGKTYIVNNDVPDGGPQYEGHRAIRIIEFDVEKEKTIGSSIMLINGGVDLTEKPIWIEGPHLYKINGKYFLMCAEGGTSVNHSEVIFRSNTVLGSYTPWEKNPILTQRHLDPDRDVPITCAGHADLMRKNNGQWWSVFLACRPIDNKFENTGRETFLLPVTWSSDGFPYMLLEENEEVPRIVQMEGVKRDSVVTFGNFDKNDEFDSSELGMEWMTLRGDANGLYSLTDNSGFLDLQCANIASNELKCPAFVSRRLQHHKFECSTSMYYTPDTESESAGLLMMKDETHQYLFVVEKVGDKNMISLKNLNKDKYAYFSSKPININKQPIKLKIVSDGNSLSFYYVEGKGNWQQLVDGIDAAYLSTATSYGFTGTCVGLYASNKK